MSVPRRTWLTSPQYLRELSAQRGAARRVLDPRTRPGPNTFNTGAKLIGLMLNKDEHDILPVSLGHLGRWFDAIYVLEGTEPGDQLDQSRQIYERTPVIAGVFADDMVPAEARGRDGCRQILLDAARRDHGVDNWIAILHGDEVLQQSPRLLLSTVDPSWSPSVRVRVAHHFLHSSAEADWAQRQHQPVRDRVEHLMWPGVPETRFFFDRGIRDYEPTQHSQVVPRSMRIGPLVDGYVIHQFNYRTPCQALARARDRTTRAWQPMHYRRLVEQRTAFTDSLHHPELPGGDYEHLDAEPPVVHRSRDTVPWIDVTTPDRAPNHEALDPRVVMYVERARETLALPRRTDRRLLKAHLRGLDRTQVDSRPGVAAARDYLRRGLLARRTSPMDQIAFLDEFVLGLTGGLT